MSDAIVMAKAGAVRSRRILRDGEIPLAQLNDYPWRPLENAEPSKSARKHAARLTRVGFRELKGADRERALRSAGL